MATVGDQSTRDLLNVSYTLYLLVTRCVLLAMYVAVAVPGSVLASPCIIITRVVAYRKAKAAVRGSTVKNTGLDVAATWKVLVAMVLVPVLHVTYTTIAYLWYGDRGAILYFFCMPFVSYSSVLASEEFFKVFKSLWPLLASVSHGKEQAACARHVATVIDCCSQRVVTSHTVPPPLS